MKATKASATSAKITWSKVNGVTGYTVYRATTANGKYSVVASITTELFIDKKLIKGKLYYYKVAPYKTTAGKKMYSDYSMVVKLKQ
jgi:lactocepin